MSQAAYLRVYVPADSVDGFVPHRGGIAARHGVMTNNEFGVLYESARDDAFVLEVDGQTFVCPRNPKLRMLEGLLAFRNAYQGPTANLLVPEHVADRASHELDRIHDRTPGVRSHILTSPWHVPLRWFVAFDADERQVVDGDTGLIIRYRTTRGNATRRLQRAVRVLEEAGFDDMLIDQVRDVVAWIDPFPEASLVELDYDGVAELFPDGDLALDDTAAEVAASLDALERGDFEEAGEHYATAATRWAHAQSLSYVN